MEDFPEIPWNPWDSPGIIREYPILATMIVSRGSERVNVHLLYIIRKLNDKAI